MQANGCEIKGEHLTENAPKYIAFRPHDRERFIRGSVKSLGTDYTKERIKERIDAKLLNTPEKISPFLDKKILLSGAIPLKS